MNDELEFNQEESDDLFEHQRIIVDKGQTPLRIDKFLMDRLERVSRNKIQNAIKGGAIRVDDKDIKSNFIVKPGQVITLVLPTEPRDTTKVLAEPIPLDIRYEDDDLMVIYKPAGMVVHPAVGNWTGTLLNALAWHLFASEKDKLSTEPVYTDIPSLAHRIDKDTSGIMVVPKSELAATHLAKQFFDHTIQRSYQALVWGEPDPPGGTLESFIGRNPKNRLIYSVYPEGEAGKWAVTHYEVIEPLFYVSLVKCTLETGRTHQIRVHMKEMGHPLFSDEKYGGNEIRKGTVFTKYKQFVQNCFKIMPRQALHATSLGFVHPRSGEFLYFEAELPEDFSRVLDKWRKYLDTRKNQIEYEDE